MMWMMVKSNISSEIQSFTFTESMISFPYASNLISNALHLAANSTFHASFPKVPSNDLIHPHDHIQSIFYF